MGLEGLPEVDVTTLRGRRAVQRWERVSVGDMLERVTWSYPDKEAIVGWDGAYAHPQHARLTYVQADALANRVATALLGRGLEPGDRVLLVCENSVEAYVTKLGIAKAGMVCVPVNPLLAPDVLTHMIVLTSMPAMSLAACSTTTVTSLPRWSRSTRSSLDGTGQPWLAPCSVTRSFRGRPDRDRSVLAVAPTRARRDLPAS